MSAEAEPGNDRIKLSWVRAFPAEVRDVLDTVSSIVADATQNAKKETANAG